MALASFSDLKDKSVFITGGGSGIGAALTDAFLEQGANVAFVQRSDASAFCDEMHQKHGRRPHFQPCDITDVTALKDAIANASDAQGDIEVLVNNAANDLRHKTETTSEADWDRLQDINLKCYFFACQAVVPGMKKKGAGAIVNFSSISYLMGIPDYPAYVTANAGIVGMTRGLAREFGPDGIRVNALAPGWVMTQKQLDQWVTPEAIASHLERQAIKEKIQPQDIAGTVLFLSSGISRMLTGQLIAVDGGVVSTG